MTSFLALMTLGFVLGMRHATDPDHVIAVTTIVARQKSSGGAAVIGAAWGVGHTLTILVVGGAIIVFEWAVPPRLGLSMEFSVGVMLVVLGVMNVAGVANRVQLPALVPAEHPHPHDHERPTAVLTWLDHHLARARAFQLVRPLFVGVIHGLAGSAAVALLVLATISNVKWAPWYLLVFGLGTIVGMTLMTALIAMPFTRARRRDAAFSGKVRVASGVISICFGLLVAWRIGIADGLFTANPMWTPH